MRPNFRFCPMCGESALSRRQPPTDTHERLMCSACGFIHYENPKVITGGIIEQDGKYLLCQRAIPPRPGTWTLPAGFMENGETTEQAALREIWEETGVRADILCPYSIFSVPMINEVYIIFRAVALDMSGQPGPETLDYRFFAPGEIPWEEIYYPAIRQILERYIAEREAGTYGIYMGSDETGKVHFMQ